MSFQSNIGFFDGEIHRIMDRGLTKSEVPHCLVMVQQPVIDKDAKRTRNLRICVWVFGPEAVEVMDKFEAGDKITLTYTLRAHMMGRMISTDVTCLSLQKVSESAVRETGDLSVLAGPE